MHTCMTYAMYISLQPYVGRRIRGKCGMPPPPPRLDLFTCMHYAFEPHLKIPGHANEYMSVIAWSTIVGRQIRGIRGASPPPPPHPVGFRFEYMHSNPISRFLAIYANAYVSVTQLILV